LSLSRSSWGWLLAIIWLLSAPATALAQQAGGVATDYEKARQAYYRFKADKQRQKFRHNWQKTAKLFDRVAERHPDSAKADDALFTAGRLYYDLYVISRVQQDLDAAVSRFRKLVADHPDSHLADDAQLSIALQWLEFRKKPEQAARELAILVEKFPEGDVTPKAKRMLEDLGEGAKPGKPEVADKPEPPKPKDGPKTDPKVVPPVAQKDPPTAAPAKATPAKSVAPVLIKVSHDAGPEYTRVTLHTRATAVYQFGGRAADKKNKIPRLYVYLKGTTLDPALKGPIKLSGSVVERIRFAPYSKDVVRVVLDLKLLGDHKVFPMAHPARVVVDVSASEDRVARIIGSNAKPKKPPKPKPPTRKKRKRTKPRVPSKAKSSPELPLSLMAGLKVRRVVIDPGHGGRDPGAIGPKKTLEKDITLDIALRLAKLMRKDKSLGLKEVILTRSKDEFVALERRAALANRKKADLFISIHCNAHRIRRFRGVETFYLDLTNDRYSIKLAARENATSEKTISDLQLILADLALKSHVDESIRLGRSIQKATVGSLRRKYKRIKDLRLKPALFYVLIGAKMPSVLVEASFMSNPEEEGRLRTKIYRQRVAEGIHTGVRNFIQAREKELDPDS
jgi:N-acetylmuramoyl-L-alanine amidase